MASRLEHALRIIVTSEFFQPVSAQFCCSQLPSQFLGRTHAVLSPALQLTLYFLGRSPKQLTAYDNNKN